jgi:dCTP deaminase
MLLPDHEIARRNRQALDEDQTPLIDPFYEHQIDHFGGTPIISYGLTSYGYDVRVGHDFRVFVNTHAGVIDPKNLEERCFEQRRKQIFEPLILPPNSFVLAESIEKVKVPRDCLVRITGKSTYARSAQIVPVTPLEPEWEGVITIEISNTAPMPAYIWPGEGIMQLNFDLGLSECRTSYADRKGRYQNQTGITLPHVRRNT